MCMLAYTIVMFVAILLYVREKGRRGPKWIGSTDTVDVLAGNNLIHPIKLALLVLHDKIFRTNKMREASIQSRIVSM